MNSSSHNAILGRTAGPYESVPSASSTGGAGGYSGGGNSNGGTTGGGGASGGGHDDLDLYGNIDEAAVPPPAALDKSMELYDPEDPGVRTFVSSRVGCSDVTHIPTIYLLPKSQSIGRNKWKV